jgi:hypothetical protein
MLEEALGKVAVEKTQVYEWHKHFCDGCLSVNYEVFFDAHVPIHYVSVL